MPIINSPYWDPGTGVCSKHREMAAPECRQCLEEQDPDVYVRITDNDIVALDWGEPEATIRDLLPEEHADWLIGRIEPFSTCY